MFSKNAFIQRGNSLNALNSKKCLSFFSMEEGTGKSGWGKRALTHWTDINATFKCSAWSYFIADVCSTAL